MSHPMEIPALPIALWWQMEVSFRRRVLSCQVLYTNRGQPLPKDCFDLITLTRVCKLGWGQRDDSYQPFLRFPIVLSP